VVIVVASAVHYCCFCCRFCCRFLRVERSDRSSGCFLNTLALYSISLRTESASEGAILVILDGVIIAVLDCHFIGC